LQRAGLIHSAMLVCQDEWLRVEAPRGCPNLVQYLLNEIAMIEIRRIHTHVEDIHHEFGPAAAVPLRRGAIAAVLTNPFAGRYVAEIVPMMDALQPVGIDMAERLRAAMGVPAERIESYGKGAIIGANGELEHGALWHVPGGYAMRELLGWKGDRNAYAQGKASPARRAANRDRRPATPSRSCRRRRRSARRAQRSTCR